MSRLRLSRGDLLLLLALLLISSVWVGIRRSTPEVAGGKERLSAWRQQEDRIQERLRSTFSSDPEGLKARMESDPALMRRLRMASVGVSLLMIGSLWGFLRLLSRWIRRRPIAGTIGHPPPPAWTLGEILRLVVGVMVVSQMALLLQWALLAAFRPGWIDRHVLSIGNTLLVDLLVIVGAGILLRRRVVPGAKTVKLYQSFTNMVPGTMFGFGSYLTSLPILGMVVLLASVVLQFFHQEPAPQPIFTIYLSETRTPVVGWLLMLVAVVGPIAEEMFFRGLLYGWLRVRIGVRWGLLLSALLFSALHADPFAFAPIFGLGMLFGWVYERTGSLTAPIAVHMFHNAGMLVLASLVKQIVSLG